MKDVGNVRTQARQAPDKSSREPSEQPGAAAIDARSVPILPPG
jgi:hypothetical protein